MEKQGQQDGSITADRREFLVIRIPLFEAKPGKYYLEIGAAVADFGRR